MNWIRIYFDLVSNLFIFFTMELFAEYKLNTQTSHLNKRRCTLKIQ